MAEDKEKLENAYEEEYEDFDPELIEEEDDDEDDRRGIWTKRLGIAALILIGIIIIILLIKGCGGTGTKKPSGEFDMEKTLLNAGKEYFDFNEHLLASSTGECAYVTLETLVEFGLIDPTNYESCDNELTYVKVCKLESGGYQWTPWLTCSNFRSDEKYGTEKEGKESDLIVDESDIRFMFLAQKLNSGSSGLGKVESIWQDEIKYSNYKTLGTTKYYRYKDQEFIWNINIKYYYTTKGDKTKASDVNEYYTSSPKAGYTNKDNPSNNAAKWYTTTAKKTYWLASTGNPGYSEKQPSSEFPYYEGGEIVTKYRSRTWTEVSKPTTAKPNYMYECQDSRYPERRITTFYPCGQHPATENRYYTIQIRSFYTCDGINSTTSNATCYQCSTGLLKADKTSCGSYGAWSSITDTKCTGSDDLCQKATVTYYNWYKLDEGARKYYPSGSSTASGEKVYYTSSPVNGAIKDTSTITTAYKWYRTEKGLSGYSATPPQSGATKTDTSRWSSWTAWSTKKPANLTNGNRKIESRIKVKLQQILGEVTEANWVNVTDTFVTEQEMIKALQNLGFNVNNLSDINTNGELKYQVKMYIRNKEVR